MLTSVVIFLWTIVTGALIVEAQLYQSSNVCDSSRLIRCQQDILRDLQSSSLQAASIQYPINGPPYSPKQPLIQQSHSSQINSSICRLIRSNLDCLLVNTPACYDQGLQIAQNTDLILRSKRYLEQNGCNDPDTSWQGTFCYRSPEVKGCEERYGFITYNPSSLVINTTACLAYQAFKHCVDAHLRFNCKVHEMDMFNEYLIDRGSDLTWRCPANISATSTNANFISSSDPYRLNNPSNQVLSPYSNYGVFDQQRPIPTYVGSHSAGSNNLNLFGSTRDQAWEKFRNPIDEARYGISRYPGSGGSGEVFDRLIAGELDSSDCPVRAAPYARECEDTLLDQQRLARDSRDGNELQRRICCSLFQYRDCISRVVLDRCADSSQAAVEVLMGVRRREMTLTCRGFNRDICSGSLTTAGVNFAMIFTVLILASFMTFKQSLNG